MITFHEAKKIAETEINKHYFSNDDSLIIVDSDIIEKEYAWIFPYGSKKFIETNDFRFAIAGNAPIFVSKIDGKISTYRTGLPFQGMINEHEEVYKIWTLGLIDDIFADTEKMLDVKHILNLTIKQLTNLKASKTLEIGAKERLLKIKDQLKQKNIETAIQISSMQ